MCALALRAVTPTPNPPAKKRSPLDPYAVTGSASYPIVTEPVSYILIPAFH